MLKVELEQEVKDLKLELKNFKESAKRVAEEALDENCSDALPYVTDLDTALNLGMSRRAAITFDIDVPLNIERDYVAGMTEVDFKLTYRGKEVNINSLDDLEIN